LGAYSTPPDTLAAGLKVRASKGVKGTGGSEKKREGEEREMNN